MPAANYDTVESRCVVHRVVAAGCSSGTESLVASGITDPGVSVLTVAMSRIQVRIGYVFWNARIRNSVFLKGRTGEEAINADRFWKKHSPDSHFSSDKLSVLHEPAKVSFSRRKFRGHIEVPDKIVAIQGGNDIPNRRHEGDDNQSHVYPQRLFQSHAN